MTTTMLDEDTRKKLRSKFEKVGHLVEESSDEHPSATEELSARAERRWKWYRRVENGVLDVSALLPSGVEEPEIRQLLQFLVGLRQAIEDDKRVTDERRKVRLKAMQMGDVLRRLTRRLEHARLEDPDEAARFILDELSGVPVTSQARLLGVTTRTISSWRSGKHVRQNVERLKLVAQLIAYLRASMTPTGLLMWFDSEADRLHGRTPLAMMDESVTEAWAPLISYARGGRGQLAG